MRGLWYDPQVHDWGTPMVQAAMRGAQMGMSIKGAKEQGDLAKLQQEKMGQEIETGKIDLKQKKDLQAANEEIATLAQDFEKNRQALLAERPQQPTIGQPLGTEPAQPSLLTKEQATPLAVNAEMGPKNQETPLAAKAGATAPGKYDTYRKSQKAFYENLAVLRKNFNTGVVSAYTKRGLTDKAMAFQDREVQEGAKVAQAYGPEAGVNYMKYTSQADEWQDAKIIEKKDHWEVKNFGYDRTGVLKFNKQDGSMEVIKQPEKRQEKEEKDRFVVGHDLVDREGNVIHTAPYKGPSGAGGDERLKGYEVSALEKNVQKAFLGQALENVTDEEIRGKITPANAFNYLTPAQQLTYRGVVEQAQKLKSKDKKLPDTVAVSEALKMDYTGGGGGTQPAVRKDLQPGGKKATPQVTIGNKKYVKVTEDSQGIRWGYTADGKKERITGK